MNLLNQWQSWLDRIWESSSHPWRDRAKALLRLLICTLRELSTGELTLRAMSLVYTTLLSLVPLLALAFSILKGLGIHNRIEPMLAAMLEPLGPSAEALTQMVIGFVDNVKIGVLGSIGVALLFYTVLAMIQKVEASFNFIWKIPRQRPLPQRITEYLVVLLMGPLAISLILGITASMSSNRVVSGLMEYQLIGLSVFWAGRLLPYVLVIGVFSFVFMFIPNTRVRLLPALAGGLVSGLLWQSAAWVFANFVAGSANYNAVYSSFAIVILLLIWLYLAWLILLTGCQITFFMQHPEYLSRQPSHPHLNGNQRDLLILRLICLVQDRFIKGRPGLLPEQVVRQSQAPPELVNPLLDEMVSRGILAETNHGELLPGQDAHQLKIVDLLNQMNTGQLRSTNRLNQPAVALGKRLEQARADVLGDMTLAELLETETAPPPADPKQLTA